MWLRKSFVHLLSLILLFSLVSLAVSVGTNLTLSEPTKLEKALDDSKFYDSFATYAAEQTQKIAGHDAAASVQLKDPAIKQAAANVFTPQFLKQTVAKILNSNYDWLKGKTDRPDFAVDLSGAKQVYAASVGGYVKDRLAGLPTCTPAQLAQLPAVANVDWLNIECRPAALSPEAARMVVTQQLANSDDFLDNPQLTAQSIGSQDSGGSQPYYTQLSSLPKVYQFSQKLPIIAAVLALLGILGIVFIHPDRRRGLKRVGIVALTAGILLALEKLISDVIFTKLEQGVFNQSSTGPLQHSLVDALHRIEAKLVMIDFYFAAAYLLLGIALLLWLRRGRAKPEPVAPAASPAASEPIRQPQAETPPAPPAKKPPRLIQ
jgi:cation transport regulator ChaB